MKITWLTLIVSLGVMSPAFGQQMSAADQEMMKVRQAMSEQFAAALAKKDPVAMADLYTVDVVTAGLCPERPPAVGRAAQAQRFEALLKAGPRNYSSKIKEVALLGDGLAWSTGTQAFTITDKDGKPQEVRGNWIDMLKREGTVWRVSFQATARVPCSP